jgi:hypothetical protein
MLDSYNAAEHVAAELLHRAQERYMDMAAYRPKPRRLDLTITFQSDGYAADESGSLAQMEMVVDEKETSGEEEAGSSSGLGRDPNGPSSSVPLAVEDDPNRIGPIRVDESDTIVTVEAKILAELRRKGLANKKFRLYPYVVAALKGREFPLDASLLNFGLPSTLNIIV